MPYRKPTVPPRPLTAPDLGGTSTGGGSQGAGQARLLPTLPKAPPGDEPHLRMSFPGTPLSVRKALATVQSGLEDLALLPEETGTIELVLAEALNNVVEHAYQPEDRGWITLECRQRPDGLHFAIHDKGRQMPEGLPPMGRAAPLPETLEALPEGGFGWFLIRDLSRDIRYSRHGDTNALRFRINLGHGPAPDGPGGD